MLNKKPYRGTRDFFPKEKRIQDFIFQRMRDTAESFGYECYDGPLLEETNLYRAKSGQELVDQQVYSFLDRGEREVAIRPEMTPTLARMIARCHREEIKPIRWFSIPNLMRYERPQKGRLREHWQFNCDIFGALEVSGTLEIIQVLINFLESFGADERHFTVLFNDRKMVDWILFEMIGIDRAKREPIYQIIDKSRKISSEKLEQMLGELKMDTAHTSKLWDYLRLESFEHLKNFLTGYEQEKAPASFYEFLELAEKCSISQYISFNPAIVRGVDYYTGLVFEVFDKHPDNPRAICGGGYYANLLQIFNEQPLPGVGFGMGDVTLVDFLKTHDLLGDFSRPKIDLFLSFETPEGEHPAWVLSNQLRKLGANTLMGLMPLKTKKAFDIAEKKGAAFIGFVDPSKEKDKAVYFKNLQTKEQHHLSLELVDTMASIILGKV